MEKIVNTVYKSLENIFRAIVVVLLTFMVVIVFANVVSRYYLQFSLAWSEEVTRFMLVWLVFLGSFLAYIHDEHLGLDIFVQKLSTPVRRVVAVATNILVVIALYAILEGGYLLMRDNFDWLSPAAEIPQGYVYMVIPLVCGLMILQVVLKTYFILVKKNPFSEGSSC